MAPKHILFQRFVWFCSRENRIREKWQTIFPWNLVYLSKILIHCFIIVIRSANGLAAYCSNLLFSTLFKYLQPNRSRNHFSCKLCVVIQSEALIPTWVQLKLEFKLSQRTIKLSNTLPDHSLLMTLYILWRVWRVSPLSTSIYHSH